MQKSKMISILKDIEVLNVQRVLFSNYCPEKNEHLSAELRSNVGGLTSVMILPHDYKARQVRVTRF